jgi:hypothetical protein
MLRLENALRPMRIRPTPLLALALASCVTSPGGDQPPRTSPPTGAEARQAPGGIAPRPEELSSPAAAPRNESGDGAQGQPNERQAETPLAESNPAPKAPQDAETARLRDLAHAAIDRGDWVGALALIHDILTEPRIAQARALLVEGRDAEALAITQEVLAVAPAEPRALLVHAEASLVSELARARARSGRRSAARSRARRRRPKLARRHARGSSARPTRRSKRRATHARRSRPAVRACRRARCRN